jgi:tRNA pseudouridine55 synthase
MTTRSELHGVLVVDKARGPTSHDVVGVARRVLGTREIGHTGTLDPMATGVLVLVVGEATKLVNYLAAHEKRYEATIQLGASTHTLDAEGEVDAIAEVPALSEERVRACAARFVGEIEQRAPMVSAIKVDGTSLHKRARRGEAFEAPLRRVRLHEVELRALREREIELSVRCGSGFYVRSFARDLAESLGTLGHLSALRRTHNGAYEVAGAVTFDELRAAKDDESARAAIRARVVPFREVCTTLAQVALDEAGVSHAHHGRPIPREHVQRESAREPLEGAHVAFDALGAPVALVEPLADHWRVLRGFRLG